MKHLAVYLLLVAGGNDSPSAADIKKVEPNIVRVVIASNRKKIMRSIINYLTH